MFPTKSQISGKNSENKMKSESCQESEEAVAKSRARKRPNYARAKFCESSNPAKAPKYGAHPPNTRLNTQEEYGFSSEKENQMDNYQEDVQEQDDWEDLYLKIDSFSVKTMNLLPSEELTIATKAACDGKLFSQERNFTAVHKVYTPWRFFDPSIIKNPHFLQLKQSSLPRLSQELVLNHIHVRKLEKQFYLKRVIPRTPSKTVLEKYKLFDDSESLDSFTMDSTTCMAQNVSRKASSFRPLVVKKNTSDRKYYNKEKFEKLENFKSELLQKSFRQVGKSTDHAKGSAMHELQVANTSTGASSNLM